jgi:hypothetical protein
MNASVERGLVAVLREALPGLHVREATSADPLPSDLQLAVVECASIEHVAGPLHRATIKVWLGTPAFEASEAEHGHVANRLCSAITAMAEDQTGTAAAFDAACEGLSWRGCFPRSVNLDIEDNTWRTTAEIVIGLAVG